MECGEIVIKIRNGSEFKLALAFALLSGVLFGGCAHVKRIITLFPAYTYVFVIKIVILEIKI